MWGIFQAVSIFSTLSERTDAKNFKANTKGMTLGDPKTTRVSTAITNKLTIPVNSVIQGDCEEVLSTFPDSCIDLIVTSPPYGQNRRATYQDIPIRRYVEWFMPKADHFRRVLKHTGTFILNIKERVVDGERHTYVLELIMAMKRSGWLWTEEFMWHKKNSYPGKWPNRFRDNWER
jgi:site-specific DNA-methyltransferase (adenine-specific)/site-specific DNA-methyltransferase (cytosine-N4-specific)